MPEMTEKEKIAALTGETDNDLVSLVYEDAVAEILAQTRRTELIEPLKKAVRDMAVIALNRLGTEGERDRTEAGEKYTFDDMPEHIQRTISMYRLARVGGKVYEKKTTSDEADES